MRRQAAHLLLLSLLTASTCGAAEPDREADRRRLLELHERQRVAHLREDPNLLVSMLAEDFVSIEDGVTERLDHDTLRKRFANYFAAVDFVEWSDLRPPEITISGNGTLATVVVRKRVRLRAAAQPDGPIQETRFAWLESWRKRAGRWEMIALSSTEGPPVIASATATEPEPKPRQQDSAIELREVAPGVFAALTPPALRFADANSTVIVTEREAIVVDVPGRPERAAELVARIAELTGKPVRYLVLTHWHGDHAQLAGLLLERFPELEIVAHPSLVDDLPGRTAPALAAEADELATAIEAAERRQRSGLSEQGEPLRPEESEELGAALERARERLRILRQTQIVRPTLLVPNHLVLRRDGLELRISHLPGHTEGDLVVLLPRERVIITGDLLDAIPFAGHGDLGRWIASLDALERLDFDTVVPGHGDLLHGKEHLRLVRDFLRSIRDQVEGLVADGVTLEAGRERVDVERFRDRLAGDEAHPNRAFDQFRDAAIERAWELAASGR